MENDKSLTTTNGAEIVPSEALPADQNPALVYLGSLARGSRRTMRQALDTIAAIISNGQADAVTLPWGRVRFQHTAAIRQELAERYTYTTANKMLSALRGTLKAAWQLGQMSGDDYHKAKSVKNVQGETLPAGRALPDGELRALLLVCANDPGPAGARDAAMVALLYSCGLRRAELVGLDLGDYEATAGTLAIRGAKRNKSRLLPVVNGAARWLSDWLAIRGDEPGPLFLAIGKGGHIRPAEPMTTQAAYAMLRRRARQAGIRDVRPHDMRRTYITDLLDAGADVLIVQKLAGHENPSTTSRYDMRPESAKREAADLLHVPYLGHGIL